MIGQVLIVFMFIIDPILGTGKCPTEFGGPPAQNCELVPGCNYPTGPLMPIAEACSNKLPDADCEQLFVCLFTSGGPATCNYADVGGDDPSLFPMVRPQACISPSLRSIALQCKYLIIINNLVIC